MRRGLRLKLLIAGLLSVLCAGVFVALKGPSVDIEHRRILVAGTERHYRLASPLRPASNDDLRPLVVALHGALDTTDQMAKSTGLDNLARDNDCVVVYLEGRHLNWPPFIPIENPELMDADLAFFLKVVSLAVDEWNVDQERVYVVGVSQGGAMTNLLVAKCSDRVAAAVCNCGWLPKPLGEQPLDTKNCCPMLFLSGTGDRQVPTEMVEEAMGAFQAAGHPCQLELIPNAGHGWNDASDSVWAFLEDKRLGQN